MDGGIVQSLGTTREIAPINSSVNSQNIVLLKIVEVVVLVVAGFLFVTWQFRDLKRAKENTRLQREAEKNQAMQSGDKLNKTSSVTDDNSDLR